MKRKLFIFSLILIFVFVFAGAAYAANSSSDDEEDDDGVSVFDPIGTVKYLLNEGFNDMMNKLATGLINSSTKILADTLFSDKDFTKQPGLNGTWLDSYGISKGLLLIIFIIGLSSAPMREVLDLDLFTLREVGFRTFFAAGASYYSLTLSGWIIEISNSMTKHILGAGVTVNNFSFLKTVVGSTGPLIEGTSAQDLILLYLVLGVLSVILAVIYALRDQAIWFLIAYAPIFTVAWVIPQTEKFAKVAFNLFVGLLLLKFIHAGLLHGFLKQQFQGGTYELFSSIGMLILMFIVPSIILGLSMMVSGSGRMQSQGSGIYNYFSNMNGSKNTTNAVGSAAKAAKKVTG